MIYECVLSYLARYLVCEKLCMLFVNMVKAEARRGLGDSTLLVHYLIRLGRSEVKGHTPSPNIISALYKWGKKSPVIPVKVGQT